LDASTDSQARGNAMTTSVTDYHPRRPQQHSRTLVFHQNAMV
jgi:hypothetical protein